MEGIKSHLSKEVPYNSATDEQKGCVDDDDV